MILDQLKNIEMKNALGVSLSPLDPILSHSRA